MRITPTGWIIGGLMFVAAGISVAKWVIIVHYIIKFW